MFFSGNVPRPIVQKKVSSIKMEVNSEEVSFVTSLYYLESGDLLVLCLQHLLADKMY